MKILNITYNKGRGGLERMYLQYNDMLRALGHEVVCMIPPNALIEKDIDTEKIITPYISNSANRFNPWATLRLRRIIQGVNPDVILVHNSRPLTLLNKASKGICPVVVVHHGGGLKRLKQCARHVICITRYMIEEIKDHGINTYYLPNAIKAEKPYHEKNLPKQGHPIKIGVMGRLSGEKGIEFFINALRHLKTPYQAIIAGDGPQKEFLQKRTKDFSLNVEFWGWIDGEKKQEFFEQCDLFIVPSRHEAFGLTIIEGWTNSIPVISTMTKGGMELIKHGENGFLVEKENAQALASTIHEVITHKDIHHITNNAYATLTSEYSIEDAQQKLAGILEDISKADCNQGKNNIFNIA